MRRQIRYGSNHSVELDLDEQALVAECERRSHPLDDPAAAVAAAVTDPLDFPALADSAFPGDHVVVALDRGVARSADVVAGVVHCLLQANVAAEHITILCANATGSCSEQSLRNSLSPEADAIEVLTHDPTDEDRLKYLAASQEGEPIYFHESLCEADVVIPISALRLSASPGYAGVNGGLYPAFGGEAAQKRFRQCNATTGSKKRRSLRAEADEAAWLLGSQFTIQVIPGVGDTILEVIAGETNSVLARGEALCQSYWEFDVPQRASLVVATIEGGPEQQTWDNLARALHSASQAVSDDGAIVLCTDLQCRPGPALQRLSSRDDSDRILAEIEKEREPDAITATLLCETQERARVYLLSNLDGDVVEELGIGHVTAAKEVERLSQQHDSCIVLANAHHAVAVANDA